MLDGKLQVDSVNFFCNFCKGGNNILFKVSFSILPLQGSLIDYLRSRGRAVITKQNQIDFAR